MRVSAKAESATMRSEPSALPADRALFRYAWPYPGAFEAAAWRYSTDGLFRVRAMPETREELAADSRWPAFFPSPICITTTEHDGVAHVEKVVGASIFNRFPYVLALSYCRDPLSSRHYVRRTFMDAVEASGRIAAQFLMPGPALQSLMTAIATVPEDRPAERLRAAGLETFAAPSGGAPVFRDSYLVYEGQLVRPSRGFDGAPIYQQPWIDVGSHRIYLFEINCISLREDIASGRAPLHWRALPVWRGGPAPAMGDSAAVAKRHDALQHVSYVKPYAPDYAFPSPDTVAFQPDEQLNGFAVKHLPPLPEDQVEVDNDRARWPCFFPSSIGAITVRDASGQEGAMTCGSTTIVSRHPLTLAICVSSASINERYAPRATLDLLANADRFGCGVPIYRSDVLEAVSYLGNVSRRIDPAKAENAGLTIREFGRTFGFAELPVHYECRIVHRQHLGTHVLFLGEVESVSVRSDLSPEAPLEWCPWAGHIAP